MQSSTAIAFRALVMLICLVSIPLFAIFGKDLPQVIKGLFEGRGLVLGPAPGAPNSAGTAPSANGGTPSNAFGAATPYRAAPPTDGGHANNLAGGAVGATGGVGPPMNAPNRTGNTALVQTGPYGSTNAALPGAPNSNNPPAMAANAADWRLAPSSPGAQPANFQAPAGAAPISPSEFSLRDPLAPNATANATAPLTNADPRATAAMANPPFPRDDAASVYTGASAAAAAEKLEAGTADAKFHAAEMRLRELGATHYMLESWGPDNNRYRFVCQMAVAGGAGMNKYFQAIEDDPWQAMDSVLHQVEDWRAGSR